MHVGAPPGVQYVEGPVDESFVAPEFKRGSDEEHFLGETERRHDLTARNSDAWAWSLYDSGS